MKIEINVNEMIVTDLIVTALEGASNYWYFMYDMAPAEIIAAEAISGQSAFNVYDIEDPDDSKIGVISADNIRSAILKLRSEMPGLFSAVMSDYDEVDWDADDADIFFQLIVMGEIVFG